MTGPDFRRQANIDAYVTRALYVHDFLKRQTDFSPRNAELSALLSGFVRETMRPRDEEETAAILANHSIEKIAPELRKLLGRTEYEMEHYCAGAMTGDIPDARPDYSSFSGFIYTDNYEALVDSELRAMKYWTKSPPIDRNRDSVAFVGAGPLPISAILFHKRTGLPVTCIDNDKQACVLGSRLINHLAANEPGYEELNRNVRYVHATGAEHDYVTHPIVFIASLVEQKDATVMRIVRTTRTATTTIIRSAEGLSTLLYKPEDPVAGQEEYNTYLVGKSRPNGETINTSLIYRFPPGKCWMRNKIEWRENLAELGVMRPRKGWMRTRPYDIAI